MSPIRAENRDRYPDDWPVISLFVKANRAEWRCECKGECGRGTHEGRCPNRHGEPAYGTGSLVVLTTAHLDHTPENCDPDNLRAMCQGCHLHYDRDHHAETRRATREARLGLVPLFDEFPRLSAQLRLHLPRLAPRHVRGPAVDHPHPEREVPLMAHRRPSPARTTAAGTAAALVVGWLAAAAFLNQLLLRLLTALGTVGAYAAVICIVMLAAAAYMLLGRRFAVLDEPEQTEHSCGADAVEHAVSAVDAQVAQLVRAGVDEDAARGLVRDMLVRAATPRSSTPIEELLAKARGGAKNGEAQHASTGGQYL